MKKLILPVIPAFLFASLFASESIQIIGRIINSETGEPIEMVNVFLANTLMGCATDRDGRFVIKDVPNGIYDLVAHHVGFEGANVRVDLLNRPNENWTLRLQPRILEGRQVRIEAEPPKEWIKMLNLFTREFLGQSGNSRKCAILNPEYLNFQYDEPSGLLTASMDRALKIRNDALGYSIELLLQKFEFSKSAVVYSIIPHFIDLSPSDPSENQRWSKARQRTYLGSFRHFMSCLAANRLEEGGFRVSEMKQGLYKDNVAPEIGVEPLPEFQDADHRFRRIHFDDCLRVGSPYFPDERAIACMKVQEAIVDVKGNVYTEYAFYKSGYWSNERVADLLPNEYSAEGE